MRPLPKFLAQPQGNSILSSLPRKSTLQETLGALPSVLQRPPMWLILTPDSEVTIFQYFAISLRIRLSPLALSSVYASSLSRTLPSHTAPSLQPQLATLLFLSHTTLFISSSRAWSSSLLLRGQPPPPALCVWRSFSTPRSYV